MKAFFRRAAWLGALVAIMAGSTPTAQAQVSRAMTVAVLTFGNTSGYGGSLLQKTASAAIESALIESGRYDVVKGDLVEKTMSDLTLSYPLGRTGIVQLATALEADAVISGDVTRVIQNKSGQVSATLRVEMTDRSSGELINGAIVTETSGFGSAGASQEILLNEALNKSAAAAVRAMNDRILPEGTVFSTSTREGQSEVLLNIGSNSGVQQGMEFIVLRNKEQVGRIRANVVSPTDTTASVTATTRGVQPEDKVRAIFRLENIPVSQGGSGSARTISRPKIKVNDLLMGVAALAGIVSLTQSSTSSGVGKVRNAVAVSTGPHNGAPLMDRFPDVPAIHIKWNRPIGIRSTDILGYFVYRRNDTKNPISVIDGDITEDYDTGQAYIVSADFDSIYDVDDAKSDGLIPGSVNQYLVVGVYNQTTTDDTGNTTDAEVRVTSYVRTTTATAIWPPSLQDVVASDFAGVPFTFYGAPGADRYVVQVANNPNFVNADSYPNKDGLAVTPFLPVNASPVMWWLTEDDEVTASLNDEVRTTPGEFTRLETINANLVTGGVDPTDPSSTLYWRVGARASRDDLRPENGGWVWSEYRVLRRTGIGMVPGPVVTKPGTKDPAGTDTTGKPNRGPLTRPGRNR